jgi:hypothetical protein
VEPRSKPEHISAIQTLSARFDKPEVGAEWLPVDPNLAFLVCIACGPWKWPRRLKVMHAVLDRFLGTPDLDRIEVPDAGDLDWYPLDWQNSIVTAVARKLQERHVSWRQCCQWWKETSWREAATELFSMCGRPNGTKTLWLFVRDHLGHPAFPIDRHVARALKKFGLPQNSWYMTQLCLDAQVDPADLDRAIFQTLSQNPGTVL